jgi:PmbA protein
LVTDLRCSESDAQVLEMLDSETARSLLTGVVQEALRAGATGAEALLRDGREFKTRLRLGVVEELRQSGLRKLGLHVLCGNRSATVATSDLTSAGTAAISREAVEMARATDADPVAALPDPALYQVPLPALTLAFPETSSLPVNDKLDRARLCEEAALSYDPRIRNSEGSEYADAAVRTTYANSHGIAASYARTSCSLSVSPLAEADGQRQRDFWLDVRLNLGDLQSPAHIGREAARRALRRLGARRIATGEMPVAFDPVAAAQLLKYLSDAVSGTAVVRRASFLAGSLGNQVASACVTVIDDGLLPDGLGSRPFDAEGIGSRTTHIIRAGRLESFLLDDYSARKLGLRSTGNSNRDPQGAPSAGPTNFYLQPGIATPTEIIGAMRRGLLVTELLGFGVNIVSGNFSQGAAGFLVENGQLAYPVEEVTVAGSLPEILQAVEMVGNDPVVHGEIFAPTLLVGKMVVSGA